MEVFHTHMANALKYYKTADHLAYITYPVVDEKKLLIVIIQNLHKAIHNAVEGLLHYHAHYKEISYVPRDFESQLSLLKGTLLRRYKFDPSLIDIFKEINDVILHHQSSSIEFIRKDAFIMASENFHLKKITIEKVKSYITSVKPFITRINGVLLQP